MGSSPAYAISVTGDDSGHLRGRANEQRVLAALNDPTWDRPRWLVSWRPATSEEDRHGIDLVILTDFGVVRFQIKSSWCGAIKFLHRHRGTAIRVIIVLDRDTPGVLRRKIMSEVNISRQRTSGHHHCCLARRARRFGRRIGRSIRRK